MTPEFWRIVESTRPGNRDSAVHANAITELLVRSGTDDTLRFAAAFDGAIDALYTWNLWGAAYLSFGGCSNDAFEYLRAWIIGEGEETWAKANRDPERLFTDLLNEDTDPHRRWEELGIHEGEPLLYAAGIAHEQLTGEWLTGRASPYPAEPAGEEFAEEELPELFPELSARLPEGWWHRASSDESGLRVMIQVERGLAAFSEGAHAAVGELLDSIVEDPDEWSLVAEDRRVDVAYVVGIGRLLAGDVDGASTALRLVESQLNEADQVRRALAQVEMARGDLKRAARFVDDSADGVRSDRVLAAKLAWRRGDHEEALRRAVDEMATSIAPDEHPWDVAGSAYQLGQLFADAGDVDNAVLAVGVMTHLLQDAPPDLPLLTHLQLLVAAIARLQGRPEDSLASLRWLEGQLGGTDLAECLREQARAAGALGHADHAATLYQAAFAAFDGAGERWEAGATRAEQDRHAG